MSVQAPKLPIVRLKSREERRLRAGHRWIYSNEIDTSVTPIAQLEPGALVRIEDSRGAPQGIAYVNAKNLLCARLLTGRTDVTIDTAWFARRLGAALALREKLYPQPFYRLVYGEADGLPGLVVDRYGDWLVAQFTTAGIDARQTEILEALQQVLSPRGIWLANDTAARQAEDLPLTTAAVGEVPESVEIVEGGVKFHVPIRAGQKTGWFYDQADNRNRLARYAPGARVLDVFSYIGAWSLRALAAGASSVTAVDSSAAALECAVNNATLNGLSLETVKANALDAMRNMAQEGRKFELVIVDPPALIKRKKDFAAGFEHYVKLNRAAIDLLTPGGFLITCSCSYHMGVDDLQNAVLRASRSAGQRARILESGTQGPDHPVHPAISETRYLKAFFCQLGDSQVKAAEPSV